jgi:hypothetical protein
MGDFGGDTARILPPPALDVEILIQSRHTHYVAPFVTPFVAPNMRKSKGAEMQREIIPVFSDAYDSVMVLGWLRKQDSNLRQAD